MSDDHKYSVEAARQAAERGELDAWVARFLASPGSDNAPLAARLSERPCWWLGPVQVPVDQLQRLAGPPDAPVLCPVDEDYWRDDVEDMAERIEDRWEPPPVIVTHQTASWCWRTATTGSRASDEPGRTTPGRSSRSRTPGSAMASSCPARHDRTGDTDGPTTGGGRHRLSSSRSTQARARLLTPVPDRPHPTAPASVCRFSRRAGRAASSARRPLRWRLGPVRPVHGRP